MFPTIKDAISASRIVLSYQYDLHGVDFDQNRLEGQWDYVSVSTDTTGKGEPHHNPEFVTGEQAFDPLYISSMEIGSHLAQQCGYRVCSGLLICDDTPVGAVCLDVGLNLADLTSRLVLLRTSYNVHDQPIALLAERRGEALKRVGIVVILYKVVQTGRGDYVSDRSSWRVFSERSCEGFVKLKTKFGYFE